MYKLYINDLFIINVSHFLEFVNRLTPEEMENAETTDPIRVGLSVSTYKHDINPEFKLINLRNYLTPGSVESIRILDEEDQVALETNAYSYIIASNIVSDDNLEPDANPRVMIDFAE